MNENKMSQLQSVKTSLLQMKNIGIARIFLNKDRKHSNNMELY